MMLRRNLVEFLGQADAEDMAILIECIADELAARRIQGAGELRPVAWMLFGFRPGRSGTLLPIFSGDCEREDYRAKL